MRTYLLIFIFVQLLLSYPLAQAQSNGERLTLSEVPPAEVEKIPNGWSPLLRLNANFSLGSSSDVIGQQDGDSITLGGKIEGGYFFKDDMNEWRNTLTYNGSTSKTPTIPSYIKSSDMLELNSIYLRSLKTYSWMGPYAQLNLQAPVFKGEDVRAEPVNYNIENGPSVSSDSFRLTDSFRPLRTKESLGFFARALDKEHLKIVTRLGFGALQVQADGQYSISSSSATDVEIKTLRSYSQAGVEAALDISGQFDEKTSYSLKTEILVPMNSEKENAADDRDAFELADVEIKASLMTKVYEWMSLNYELSAIKQPLLQERYQVSSLFTVNFSHQLF